MTFQNVYSSIVVVGSGFPPAIFSASKYYDILGKPDKSKQVVLPILLQQFFPNKKYKVTITPDRIDLGYLDKDYLPNGLHQILKSLITNLSQFENYSIAGMGINLNLVISEKDLKLTGTEYCRSKFLNITNIEKKLNADSLLANTAKLIYYKDKIKYLVDIEPFFQKQGKPLLMKLNAHQNCTNLVELKTALKKFSVIKNYYDNLYINLLGD